MNCCAASSQLNRRDPVYYCMLYNLIAGQRLTMQLTMDLILAAGHLLILGYSRPTDSIQRMMIVYKLIDCRVCTLQLRISFVSTCSDTHHVHSGFLLCNEYKNRHMHGSIACRDQAEYKYKFENILMVCDCPSVRV